MHKKENIFSMELVDPGIQLSGYHSFRFFVKKNFRFFFKFKPLTHSTKIVEPDPKFNPFR